MSAPRPNRRVGAIALLLSIALLVPAIVAGGASASPGTSSAKPKPDPSSTLRIAVSFTGTWRFTGFDSAKAASVTQKDALALIYGTPLRIGEKAGSYEPWLAKSYKVVDPTTFELDLRPGLKFSDGTPYNATNYRTGFLRNVQLANPVFDLPTLKAITDVTAEGDTKVTFHFSQPRAGVMPTLLSRLEGMVGSPNATNPATNPIGAGPYKMNGYTENRSIQLQANPGYFAPKEYPQKKVELVNVDIGQAQLNGLQAGQVDMTVVNPALAPDLKNQFNISAHAWQSYYVLAGLCGGPPNGNPLLNDPRVRQALSLAIDRQALVDTVSGGYGTPQVGLWAKGTAYAVPKIESIKRNLPKARKLLAAAGAKNLSFTVGVANYTDTHEHVTEVLQSQFKQIGVDMKIEGSGNILTYLGQFRGPWMTLANRPDQQILGFQFVDQTSVFNTCKINNPAINNDYNLLGGLDSRDVKAIQVWHDAINTAYTDQLNIPLYTNDVVWLGSKKVVGLHSSGEVDGITDIKGTYLSR